MVGRNSLESVSVKQATRKRRGAKERVNPWPLRTLKKHLLEVAHEAHMMGRIYHKGGEVLTPGDEWLRVEAMVLRYIRRINDVSK